MSDDILQRVVKVTVSKLSVEESEVVPSASFKDDLGADSLDIVELALAFEEEFNIQIPDEDVNAISTVQDVVTYINSHPATS